MNKSESKYFNTALKMDEALLSLLEVKDFEYISVKEVCKKAKVNRSTFYLHYENTYDLLEECLDLINKRFESCFENNKHFNNIDNRSLDELIFIRDDYLIPYLKFVKDNKRVFKTIHNKPAIFKADKAFQKMYDSLFLKILNRFSISQEEQKYIFEYYTKGVLSIIMKWVENNCDESIEQIKNIIIKCVNFKE